MRSEDEWREKERGRAVELLKREWRGVSSKVRVESSPDESFAEERAVARAEKADCPLLRLSGRAIGGLFDRKNRHWQKRAGEGVLGGRSKQARLGMVQGLQRRVRRR